ncbi:hypothetical protein BW731_12255 [Vagococcus martis]|uniref:DUF3899 domain-containing protein n=1 Tax=Vagococcus martis TaxID=1768210 RepID=A0A1V4DDW8_9ENTE|nr:hypothetical protein BW731_12255 [Vagococcus martis]
MFFILIAIFNVPTKYTFLILSFILFYISYQLGVKKDLSWANLVRNSDKPNETDKNIGKSTAVIVLIIGLILLCLSIFMLLK